MKLTWLVVCGSALSVIINKAQRMPMPWQKSVQESAAS